MKRSITAALASLALASTAGLTGCSGESEDAPDITEAIPLDRDEPSEAGARDDSIAEGEAANESGTPDLPGASPSGQRALPDTMESGANPPGMTQPPAGSKVQPADG